MNKEPLIVLEGLEGNAPTQLHGLQHYLAPHLDIALLLWWVIFFTTLGSLILEHIALPLIAKIRHR